MLQPFHFGDARRPLFGMLHGATGVPRGAMLMCAPLLQDGIRCQRALWLLAEALAAGGIQALRFDWYGSGDSGGNSGDMDYAGLLDDLRTARSALRASTPVPHPHLFAMRSAALPLLAFAANASMPVDLLLWDPLLSGTGLVESWQNQHQLQLSRAGRYPHGASRPEYDELLGFDIEHGLIDHLRALEADALTLPAGSRVVVAVWEADAMLERFVARQRAADVEVDVLHLNVTDRPSWCDPLRFEMSVVPRQSVADIARHQLATST